MRGPNGSGLFYWSILLRRTTNAGSDIKYDNIGFGYERIEDCFEELLHYHYIIKRTYLFLLDSDGNALTSVHHSGLFQIWQDGYPAISLDVSLRVTTGMRDTLGCTEDDIGTLIAMRVRLLAYRFRSNFFRNVLNAYL